MITVIGSLKGGSGKSTVTFNLAVWLTMSGLPLRLFDLDPQATLTDVVDVRDEEGYDPGLKVEPASALDSLSSDDHALIDIGTADMAALEKAVALADRIIMPVPPSQADIWSAQRFLRMVKKICPDEMPQVNAFINRADTHHAVRESDEAAAALITLPGLQFVKQRLSQRTAYRRSFSEGMGVFEMEARGKASREFTALAAALFPEQLR